MALPAPPRDLLRPVVSFWMKRRVVGVNTGREACEYKERDEGRFNRGAPVANRDPHRRGGA